MHPPRFTHSNYNPYQNQWRPHGPRFGSPWPSQHMHRPTNSKRQGYFLNNNEDHWCETCDRGFKTLELLITHKQQHQKCNIDGCQFIAHPKVITKHIQMQHSTGLYNKIAKLDNPEEIKKWREERRKKYPTKVNIEKKSAELKEKIDRGEKMGMRLNHKNHKLNRTEQGFKRRGSNDIDRKKFKRRFQANKSVIEDNKNKTLINDNKKPVRQKENKLIWQVDTSKGLKPFAGILNLLDDPYNDNFKEDIEIIDSIEDDEYIIMDESNDSKKSTTTEPVVCGALSSLICNYESSGEESVDKTTQPQENILKNVKVQNEIIDQNARVKSNKILENSTTIINNLQQSDDDSGPEEAEIVKADKTETNMPVSAKKESSILDSSNKLERREQQEKNKMNTTKYSPKSFKRKLPSTLLEKLLRNEIRQERNIILQCIRYIVQNNYFDKQ